MTQTGLLFESSRYMGVNFLRNSSFRWCLILLHRRDTDQPIVGIRLIVDVIGKGIRFLKPAAPSFFFSLFFSIRHLDKRKGQKKWEIYCINLQKKQDVCQANCTYGC